MATGIFAYTILVSFPITANASVWYFGTSLFALLSIVALAGLALRTTLHSSRLLS